MISKHFVHKASAFSMVVIFAIVAVFFTEQRVDAADTPDPVLTLTSNTTISNTPATTNADSVTTGVMEKSQVITASVVIEAENLVQGNNPRITGAVSAALKIENVALDKKENGAGWVVLAGKSEPGELVTIYIFSDNPIVVVIKADANGNWNYELDKELADGQHEAYAAMADDTGKIISKSEPIAFVKTAQSATKIPTAELIGNQSPLKKSTQQYILMALATMLVCLVIDLAAIGFLSHKIKANERSN